MREKYIDYSKAIGIVLVVLGHTEFIYSNFLYQFHLPLFFLLSGLVFNEKKALDLTSYIKKKIKSLYIPFVVIETIFLILHNFFSKLHLYTVQSQTKIFLSIKDIFVRFLKIISLGGGEQLAGPLWFLISTIEITIIFAILFRIIHTILPKWDIYILLILTLMLYFIGWNIKLPRMLSQSCIGIFFYTCGYAIRNEKKLISSNFIFFAISIIVCVVTSRVNVVDISRLKVESSILFIISGLCGSYACIYIAKLIEKHNSSILSYCGKNTISILALHCISFKVIMIIEIIIYKENIIQLGCFPVYMKNNIWCIPLTLTGIILPLSLKKTCDLLREFYEKKIN